MRSNIIRTYEAMERKFGTKSYSAEVMKAVELEIRGSILHRLNAKWRSRHRIGKYELSFQGIISSLDANYNAKKDEKAEAAMVHLLSLMPRDLAELENYFLVLDLVRQVIIHDSPIERYPEKVKKDYGTPLTWEDRIRQKFILKFGTNEQIYSAYEKKTPIIPEDYADMFSLIHSGEPRKFTLGDNSFYHALNVVTKNETNQYVKCSSTTVNTSAKPPPKKGKPPPKHTPSPSE